MFSKIKNASGGLWSVVLLHKFVSFFLAVVIIGGGYYAYGKLNSPSAETRYVLAAATKGTLVSSVSGTGQVSALDQVDVKPKVSGDVVYIGIKNGDTVKTGTLLAQLDTKDAERTVSDAQISLDQANLNLEKMKGLTTDNGTIRGDKQKAEDDLAKVYEDGFNTISNAFLDFPGIMSGLNDTLYGNSLGVGGQWNVDFYVNAIQNALKLTYPVEAYKFHDDAVAAYSAARTAYDANFSDYKLTSRFSNTTTIDQLINQTYTTTQLIAEAVKNANNLIQLYKDRLTENNIKTQSLADTYLSQLSGYTSKANSYLSSLLSAKTTIQNDKEAIVNVGFNVSDQEIVVAKAERSLADAKDALAEHFIRSPFAGTIAKVNVKKGDPASSGSAIATVITTQKIAIVSLNEVDVAKVKIEEKATLTFDAFSDLTIVGDVTQIDAIGTVTQGVVNYNVQIAFTTQDDRVKPSMSVSAAIITDTKTDVILVPSGAVKSQGGTYYVQILDGVTGTSNVGGQGIASKTPPRQQTVEIGNSNDSSTEITSGLKEGDLLVTRTTTATATAASPSTQSQGGLGGIRIPGLTGGGAGR